MLVEVVTAAPHGIIVGKLRGFSQLDLFVSLGDAQAYAHEESTITTFLSLSAAFTNDITSVEVHVPGLVSSHSGKILTLGLNDVSDSVRFRTGYVATVTFDQSTFDTSVFANPACFVPSDTLDRDCVFPFAAVDYSSSSTYITAAPSQVIRFDADAVVVLTGSALSKDVRVYSSDGDTGFTSFEIGFAVDSIEAHVTASNIDPAVSAFPRETTGQIGFATIRRPFFTSGVYRQNNNEPGNDLGFARLTFSDPTHISQFDASTSSVEGHERQLRRVVIIDGGTSLFSTAPCSLEGIDDWCAYDLNRDQHLTVAELVNPLTNFVWGCTALTNGATLDRAALADHLSDLFYHHSLDRGHAGYLLPSDVSDYRDRTLPSAHQESIRQCMMVTSPATALNAYPRTVLMLAGSPDDAPDVYQRNFCNKFSASCKSQATCILQSHACVDDPCVCESSCGPAECLVPGDCPDKCAVRDGTKCMERPGMTLVGSFGFCETSTLFYDSVRHEYAPTAPPFDRAEWCQANCGGVDGLSCSLAIHQHVSSADCAAHCQGPADSSHLFACVTAQTPAFLAPSSQPTQVQQVLRTQPQAFCCDVQIHEPTEVVEYTSTCDIDGALRRAAPSRRLSEAKVESVVSSHTAWSTMCIAGGATVTTQPLFMLQDYRPGSSQTSAANIKSLAQRVESIEVRDEAWCQHQLSNSAKWAPLTSVLWQSYEISTLACGAMWSLGHDGVVVGAQTQLISTPPTLDTEVYVINEERNGLSTGLFRISPPTAELVLEYLLGWKDGVRNIYSNKIADSILIQAFQDRYAINILDAERRAMVKPHALLLHERWQEHKPLYDQFRGCLEEAGIGRHPAGCNSTIATEDGDLWGISRLISSFDGENCMKDSSERIMCSCEFPNDPLRNSYKCSNSPSRNFCSRRVTCSATEAWEYGAIDPCHLHDNVAVEEERGRLLSEEASAAFGASSLQAMLDSSSQLLGARKAVVGVMGAEPREATDDASDHTIPNNILFNHYSTNYSQINPHIVANMRHLVALHPGANVIFMDDAQCLDLMRQTRHLISDDTMEWYQGNKQLLHRLKESMPSTAPYYHGKYLSDFCRLVQLYNHGGVYFDTDLQLSRNIRELLDVVNASFASVVAYSGLDNRNDIFQALTASQANTTLMARAITYFDQWIRGERSIYGLAGPSLLGQAIQDEYGTGYITDAAIEQLRAKGVFLMKEAHPTHRTVMWHMNEMGEARLEDDPRTNNCGWGLLANTSLHQDLFVGYSRMMRSGPDALPGSPCINEQVKESDHRRLSHITSKEYICMCTQPGSDAHNRYECLDSTGALSGAYCAQDLKCTDTKLQEARRRLEETDGAACVYDPLTGWNATCPYSTCTDAERDGDFDGNGVFNLADAMHVARMWQELIPRSSCLDVDFDGVNGFKLGDVVFVALARTWCYDGTGEPHPNGCVAPVDFDPAEEAHGDYFPWDAARRNQLSQQDSQASPTPTRRKLQAPSPSPSAPRRYGAIIGVPNGDRALDIFVSLGDARAYVHAESTLMFSSLGATFTNDISSVEVHVPGLVSSVGASRKTLRLGPEFDSARFSTGHVATVTFSGAAGAVDYGSANTYINFSPSEKIWFDADAVVVLTGGASSKEVRAYSSDSDGFRTLELAFAVDSIGAHVRGVEPDDNSVSLFPNEAESWLGFLSFDVAAEFWQYTGRVLGQLDFLGTFDIASFEPERSTFVGHNLEARRVIVIDAGESLFTGVDTHDPCATCSEYVAADGQFAGLGDSATCTASTTQTGKCVTQVGGNERECASNPCGHCAGFLFGGSQLVPVACSLAEDRCSVFGNGCVTADLGECIPRDPTCYVPAPPPPAVSPSPPPSPPPSPLSPPPSASPSPPPSPLSPPPSASPSQPSSVPPGIVIDVVAGQTSLFAVGGAVSAVIMAVLNGVICYQCRQARRIRRLQEALASNRVFPLKEGHQVPQSGNCGASGTVASRRSPTSVCDRTRFIPAPAAASAPGTCSGRVAPGICSDLRVIDVSDADTSDAGNSSDTETLPV